MHGAARAGERPMQRNEAFMQYERNLAQYCRTSDAALASAEKIPAARPECLAVYRRLVFNGVHENLSAAYPIAAATLGSDEWNALVEEFFAVHACPSPQLWKMPMELLNFAKSARIAERLKRPYLYDLLRFEWAEIAVHMMKDVALHKVLKKRTLQVNPYHQILEFQYAVFRLRGDDLIGSAGEYFLLVFRHIERCTVHFVELTKPLSILFAKWHNCGVVQTPGEMECGEEFVEAMKKEGALITL